ncbi:MAG: adenylate/guanylate cyclase domain-containing protein [Propionibacteriales bacterium]|nr:adenylate/guanylate cyclase domain-containing protein [Propionibacteriales bacterium]
MVAVAWILGCSLVVSLVALGVTVKLLRDARQETERLQQTVESQLVETRAPRAVNAAGRVVGKMVEAAARAREQGVSRMLVASLEDFSRWAAEQRTAIGRMAADDGTVTIMFTDIEGSTALNAGLGDTRWVRVLAAHDELVETYVEKYRGLIVKTQGDGHMVVFTTPRLALDAALDIQRAFGAKWNHSRELRRTPVKVRIGLHTGTAIERDGDYLGQNVALAARVAAQAAGGEVLVTGEIAQTCAEEFLFTDAGTVELKGFEGTQELWHAERLS